MTLRRYNPRLLTPPREEEEIYPYRRVWQSIIVEMSLLFAAAVVAFGVFGVFGLSLPRFQRVINGALALLPLGLWLIFSYSRERVVPQPRIRLSGVLIVSALSASAIGIPFIDNVLQASRWLSLSGSLDRIFGYMFAVGFVQESIKYIIIRYMVWPQYLRTRLDAVAYGAASAVGYATVANLYFAIDGEPSPDVVAVRIFSITAIHIVGSAIVAYGLSELWFNPRSLLLLPFTVFLASLVTGITIAMRAGLVNARFFLGIGGTRDVLGLLFSLAFLVGPLVAASFLFDTAERREQEAVASRET